MDVCKSVNDTIIFIIFCNNCIASGLEDKLSQLILSKFFCNNSIAFGFCDK